MPETEGTKRDLAGVWRFGLYSFFFALVFYRFWDQTIVYRDSLVFFAPNKFAIAEGLRHGRLDLWNPWILLGMPLAGEVQAGLFYPLNLLFAVLPFGVAHRLFILMHYPLAAFAMDLFLRGRGVSNRAALFGGLAFALSGYMISQHALVRMTLGGAWLPLALWCFDQASRERFFAVAAGAVLAAQILASDPETALVTAVIGTALVLARTAAERKPLAGLTAVIIAAVSAFILSAIAVLPMREMLELTTREGGIPWKNAVIFSFHPAQIIEFIWPTPFGVNWPEYNFWGHFAVAVNPARVNVPWSASNYLGLPVLALAAVGLIKSRRPWRWLLLAGAVFFLLAALGRYTPVYGWLHSALPVFNAIRYPSKFVVFVSFFLASLAAVGLETMLADLQGRPTRRAGIYYLAAVIAISWSMYFLWPMAMEWRSLFPPGSIMFKAGLAHFQSTWKLWLVVNLVIGGVWLLTAFGKLTPRLGLPLLLSVMTVDWWFASVAVMPTGPSDIYSFTPVAESAISRVKPPSLGRYRIFQAPMEFNDRNPALQKLAVETRQQVWLRNVLSPNLSVLSRMETMRGYDSYDFKGESYLLEKKSPTWVMELFNVHYLIDQSKKPIERGETVYLDPLNEMRITRLTASWPRAYFVSRPIPAVDAAESRLLLEKAWAERTAVIVGAEGGGTAGPSPLVPAEVVSYEPDRVEVQVEAPDAGWLVLSDRDFPGWKAWVDGKETEVHRANALVRAVKVDAGRHEVVFEYRPRSVLLGAMLSVPGWVVFAGVLAVRRRRRGHLSSTINDAPAVASARSE